MSKDFAALTLGMDSDHIANLGHFAEQVAQMRVDQTTRNDVLRKYPGLSEHDAEVTAHMAAAMVVVNSG